MSRASLNTADFAAAWCAARRMKTFNYNSLAVEAGVSMRLVADYVREWRRWGSVRFCGVGEKKRFVFEVVEDRETPRGPRATRARRPKGTPEGNMWRSMRGLETFSPVDIAAHSTTDEVKVSEQDASAYCRLLTRAGYLRVLRKAAGHRAAVYRLVINSGPSAPKPRRVRAVFDPNTREYTQIGGDA